MSERLMTEREFAEELRTEYRAQGFEELDIRQIAQVLGDAYEPDFAFKIGDLVDVIELKSKKNPQTANQIREFRKLVEAQPNWRFRFMVVPKRPPTPRTINAEKSVPRRLTAARDLARSDRELSIIQLWLVIEICLRRLLEARGEHLPSDSTGMQLARSLRTFGELDDEDLRLLEKGFQARNLAAHGFQLPPDQKLPAGLFDFALALCARAGIQVSERKRATERRV